MKIHSLLICTFAIAILHAQEKPADPFRETKEEDAAASEPSGPVNISLCFESFSLPLPMAAKLQREQLPDSDFYARLLAGMEKKTVRQETFMVVHCKSAQKATAEAISEQIYPTEYVPTERPGSAVVSARSAPAKGQPATNSDPGKLKNEAKPKTTEGFNTPPTPTAFDTRNVGMTLEVEPLLMEGGKTIDLRLVPELVTTVGRSGWGQGVSTTEMPVFETQRCKTSVSVLLNRPFLVSTINRPPNSESDPDAANRVWFAFITATLSHP